MVDRLSLPAIKYLTKENKNIHSTDSLHKKLSPGKKSLGHSNSSSKIMKSISSKKLNKPKNKQFKPHKSIHYETINFKIFNFSASSGCYDDFVFFL